MKRYLAVAALALAAFFIPSRSESWDGAWNTGSGSAATPAPTWTPAPTVTPLRFNTPGKIAVHSTPGANLQPYAGFTPGASNNFITALDGSGAPTLATPIPQATFAYVAPTPQTIPTAVPTLAPPTPLAFNTPGKLSAFGTAGNNFQPYPGSTPCNGYVTTIGADGQTTCGTPVPTPFVPTPVPTASLPLSSANGGTGTNAGTTTGYPVVTNGAFAFPTAIPQAGVDTLVSDLADLRAASTGGGSTGTTGSAVTSTCLPYNTTGLTYAIPSCTFTVNGVSYTSTAGNVTLGAADATNPRIDSLIFDTAVGGYASSIAGLAAVNPFEPSLSDPTTQVRITGVSIAANATTPTGLTNESIYLEGAESGYTCTPGTGSSCLDTSSPRTGTKAIKFTAVTAGNYLEITRSTVINPNAYQQKNFWIKVVSWPTGRSLAVSWRDTNGTQLGNAITVQNTSFGFSRTNTSAYQLIAVPMGQFGISSTAAASAKKLRLNPVGTGGTFSFLIDDIVLQTSTNSVAFPNPQYEARYLPAGPTYAVQEKGADGLIAASSFSANGATMSAPLAQFASTSGPLKFGIPAGAITIADAKNAQSTNTTTPTIPIPSSVLSGDRLITLVQIDNTTATTLTVSGWTAVGSRAASSCCGGAANTAWIFYKDADGTETDFTATANDTGKWVARTYRITNYDTSVAPTVAFATPNTGGVTVDPPSNAPSWGSVSIATLWIAASFRDELRTATAFPSGYSGTGDTQATSNITTSYGYRVAQVVSEDPSTFTYTGGGSTSWIGATIAVKSAVSNQTQIGATIGIDGSVNTVANQNNMSMVPKASGTPVALAATGVDTDISVNIVPKGVGVGQVSGVTIATASNTLTETNKSIDAEATGNVITIPRYFEAQGAACQSATAGLLWDTKTASAPTAVCLGGTNREEGYVNFPDSDGDFAIENSFALPASWTGAIDLAIWWKSASNSGNAAFQVATSCVAAGEDPDTAWNTAQVVVSAAQGTASRLQTVAQTSLTNTGCAAGEDFHVRILRNRTHASDTLGASPLLFRKAIFKYRTAE